MTSSDLLVLCDEVEKSGRPDPGFPLVLNRKQHPTGERVRLFPGVSGELLNSQLRPDGLPGVQIVVWVKSADIRKAVSRAAS
jgi:hypothetical protein